MNGPRPGRRVAGRRGPGPADVARHGLEIGTAAWAGSLDLSPEARRHANDSSELGTLAGSLGEGRAGRTAGVRLDARF